MIGGQASWTRFLMMHDPAYTSDRALRRSYVEVEYHDVRPWLLQAVWGINGEITIGPPTAGRAHTPFCRLASKLRANGQTYMLSSAVRVIATCGSESAQSSETASGSYNT